MSAWRSIPWGAAIIALGLLGPRSTAGRARTVAEGPAAPPIAVCKTNQRDEVTGSESLRYTICLRNLDPEAAVELVVTDESEQLTELDSSFGMPCDGVGAGGCWRWEVSLDGGGQRTLKLHAVVDAMPGTTLTNSLTVEVDGQLFTFFDEDGVVAAGEEDLYGDGFECDLSHWSTSPGVVHNIPVCKCDDEAFFSDGKESGDCSAWAASSP